MIKILQIKNVGSCRYAFMDYNYAENEFCLEDYQVVAEFEESKIPALIQEKDIFQKLEIIYGIFNRCGETQPENIKYEGRTMSNSDIVVIEDDLYYCDTRGWIKIEEQLEKVYHSEYYIGFICDNDDTYLMRSKNFTTVEEALEWYHSWYNDMVSFNHYEYTVYLMLEESCDGEVCDWDIIGEIDNKCQLVK